jgi:methyl-accepting chemotaxis protein
MFKNLKLRTKLITAFMIIAAITLILGVVGYYGAIKSEQSIHELGAVRLPGIETVLKMQVELETLVGAMRTLLNSENTKELRQQQYDLIAKARKQYGEARTVYESLTHTPEEMQEWNEFSKILPEWVAANDEILKLSHELDEIDILNPDALLSKIQLFRGDHYALELKVVSMINSGETFDSGSDPATCNFGKWLAEFSCRNSEIKTVLTSIQQHHARFHESTGQICKAVEAGNREEAKRLFSASMQPASCEIFKHFEHLIASATQAEKIKNRISELTMGRTRELQAQAFGRLNNVVQINHKIAAERAEQAVAQSTYLKVLSMAATIAGVILAVVLGAVITRAITKPINQIIAGLTEGAQQVASASGQVSAASQSLAEGATEQAAGLEETSSSLEEMSSMTKQNADNAQQANTLAAEARNAAQSGADSMQRMSQAIDDIQKSSDQTAKIIKVIDEIAFQTNLLALNAAVEAARAGEAGKGFAVVAEEVRNLAMRSAEAAKNTANMIEESVKNAKNGVEISNEVSKALEEIVSGIAKTTDLVGEIAAASSEQAQGIDQVNTAVAQMDKVTQQNAANAEESASASEELSAQAETMQNIVEELVALVEGASAQGRSRQAAPRRTTGKGTSKPKLGLADHTFHHIAEGKQKTPKSAPAKTTAKDPLPLEHEFSDFNA